MDWGAVIQLLLAVVGAAAIVGGFVLYRSSTANARAAGAGSIAAGVMMWVVVVFTIPV